MGQIFDLMAPFGRLSMGIKSPLKRNNWTNFVDDSDEKRIITFNESHYFCSSGIYPGHKKRCEFRWFSLSVSLFNVSLAIWPQEHQMPLSQCYLNFSSKKYKTQEG